MKSLVVIVSCLFIPLTLVYTQAPPAHGGGDPRYSVFGPPRPSIWEFQAAYLKEDGQNISSFNFYSKDQRNKTLFFRIGANDWNTRNQFRVKEASAGVVLFPVNDDDRLQLELGGTYDVIKDTTLAEKAIFSRITYRPQPNLWFRVGSEYYSGQTTGSRTAYRSTVLNSNYVAGKYTYSSFSLIGLLGQGKIDNALNLRYGAAGIVEGPFNTFMLGGYIKSDDPNENVRTLAVGRWAPYRADGLPSGIFVWKHKDNYDFQLGGLFWGEKNIVVRPAMIGMSQGMFISSTALRENSALRQGQLMTVTDDYRNSNYTIFYVSLDQSIAMIPGTVNHVGFRAVEFFRNFETVSVSIVSHPVLGLFYNEETEPVFTPAVRKFSDVSTTFWTFQAGVTLMDSFVLNVLHTPKKDEWAVALSFVLTADEE